MGSSTTAAGVGPWGPAPTPMPDYGALIDQPRILALQAEAFHQTENLRLVIHPGLKCRYNLLPLDRPWEQPDPAGAERALFLYSILRDETTGEYKMWYGIANWWPNAAGVRTVSVKTLYATSRDGLNWVKPILELYVYGSSNDNNIVYPQGLGEVIYDRAEPNPEHRYKAMAGSQDGLVIFFSPDGIHWTPHPNNPVLDLVQNDGGIAFFDPQLQRYAAFVRSYARLGEYERRALALTTSDDFMVWSPPVPALAPDEQDDIEAQARQFALADFYGLTVWPYSGVYLGFPLVFLHLGLPGQPGANDGPFDVQLAYSNNLTEWHRPDRTPIIPRGPEGSFDSGIITVPNAPIVVGGELWYYYVGDWHLHLASQRDPEAALAKWRLDGFASLQTEGEAAGRLTTYPQYVTGDQLIVNARVGQALYAELLDETGAPIPGFTRAQSVPVTGDSLTHHMRWQGGGDLARLKGQRVEIRLYLEQTDFYAMWFGDSRDGAGQ